MVSSDVTEATTRGGRGLEVVSNPNGAQLRALVARVVSSDLKARRSSASAARLACVRVWVEILLV